MSEIVFSSGGKHEARATRPRPSSQAETSRSAVIGVTRYRIRQPAVLAALGGVLALLGGIGLDAVHLRSVDWLPFAVVAAFVVLRRAEWASSTLILCGTLLAVARSTIAPDLLASSAPIAVLVVCGAAVLRHRRAVVVGLPTILTMALGLVLIITTAVTADVATTVKGVGIALMWPLILLVASGLNSRQRRQLMVLFVAFGLIEVVVAVGESLLQWSWWRDLFASSRSDGGYVVRGNRILGSWTNRAQGTTGYPIPLAVVLAVALLISAFGRIGPRWSRPVVWLLLCTGIVLTGTRSAIAFGAVAVAVGLVLELKRAASRRTAIIASIAILAAAVGGVLAFLVRSIVTDDFSLVHRSGVIESAADLFGLPLPQVIFGSGYNAANRLQAAGLLRVDSASVVDNAYVTAFANTGLVGLALLLAVLAFALARGELVARTVVLCIAIAMFSFDLQYWHLLTIALLVVVGSLQRSSSNRTRAPGRRFRQHV